LKKELESVVDLINSNQSKICAIGEIGLDHHFIKDKGLYPLQTEIFMSMLSLAQKLQLPVNLHSKGAENLIFDILSSYKIPKVNIHWYSGPEKYLKIGKDRGYYFSITPAIKYSPAVQKTALLVDIDHLLLESDGPVKFSGEIGTPAMIKDVINRISSIKKINNQEVERRILENTKNVFPRIFS
jgi:TatD DNase family protein